MPLSINGKINAKLGIGPVSSETIEAAVRYSNYHRKELMLIASKNQIDFNGGYVNGWNTKEFVKNVNKLQKIYSNSNIKLCRDHCGPGFNSKNNLKDSYQTIETDIENKFDLIHVDFCHFKGNRQKQLEETKKAIQYALSLNSHLLFEIGTDENIGIKYGLTNISEIEKEINYFKSFCNPEFYVVQTGSLVKEINQVGIFNQDFIKKISLLTESNHLKLKEHNADYLDSESISLRKDIVSAMNVAPQFGVVQTQTVLNKCLLYGIDTTDFLNESYQSKKWFKWLQNNTSENKMLCSIISGHYVFNSKSYKDLIAKLNKHEDIKETIINSLMELIDHYEQ